MIRKILCNRCSTVVGAEDTNTGEREYVGGVRHWDDKWWCRDCYNKYVLEKQPFMGGIDGIEVDPE